VDEETRLVVTPDGGTPAEAEVSAPPAPNEAEQLAAATIAALDVIASRLQLETPHPKTARRVRGARTVPPEFVASMIASADARHELRSFGTFDPEEARRALQSREALRIISERVTMFLASVNYTIEAQWAKVARSAVATFSLASILAEEPEHAELAAHIETLRRHLGRTNKPKKKRGK
jgi:hypothetical protein